VALGLRLTPVLDIYLFFAIFIYFPFYLLLFHSSIPGLGTIGRDWASRLSREGEWGRE
jgi:hypothetical protein